jgi:putative ATP-dependent endonuclease of OLD family
MKDDFMDCQVVKDVNDKINKDPISEKNIELSVDVSTKSAWETSLVTCLDKIPFHFVGRGEQCLIKTKLALNHKKTTEANIILLEEPENHLSHSKLNVLINYIKGNNEGKQIIISTHSSFVANKLGLGSLILLNVDEISGERKVFRIKDLNIDTQKYFEKLPGFDTLRLILCKKAILVEGDCDELVVQKAYSTKNAGKLPIENGVDVISVRGLSFKRFLEIAKKINQPTVVITDNDGNFTNRVTEKYKEYEDCATIKIFADTDNTLTTLEPQIVNANKAQLDILRRVLEISESDYPDEDSIKEYMTKKINKTDCALKIFDTTEDIKFPQYILDAISYIYE